MPTQLINYQLAREHQIPQTTKGDIQLLLTCSFDNYPSRSYYKQLPYQRLLAWSNDHLVAHLGIDYRMMSLSQIPICVVGGIDLCVYSSYRSHGIGSELLNRLETFALRSNSDFIILFADDDRIYAKHGYQHADNPCRWLKINEHTTLGVAEEPLPDALMYKCIGATNWRSGVLDLLGYLY